MAEKIGKNKQEKTEQYDFKEAEQRILKFWEKEKVYSFNVKKAEKEKQIFSIDTPPPTVSGKMHIGHAFQYSQTDFIARYKRMQGMNVFYPFGTDDNGLPTERLVEKTMNIKAKDMSREKFIQLCMNFLKKELPQFIQDWKNIGISADFDIYYSTINEHSRRISQWSFIDLYKKGRAYRKDAPSMFCPECRTGVAQVEIKDKEIETTFNTILFKIGNENIEIATTRPELLAACVAVFYHPDDKRYKKFKGKMAKVPLFNFSVPIMEDKRAQIDKGTGIVMCCTFGDQTDMEWQKAYNLEIKEAITKEGRMSEITGKYSQLSIKEARKSIIEDLKKENLLIKEEKIKHFVNVHERCNIEIEFIKSRQWFVKYLDLKEKMLEWGNKIKWHPEFMKTRYDNWVNGLQWDWLISNQRHFGVPFPVWYCNNCNKEILAEEKQLPVNPLTHKPLKKCSCGSNDFLPEKDILNTWFTSSMTPQIAIKLMPEKVQNKLFPMDVRGHAHEIITFWSFNTIFKSNIHFNNNPWKNLMISGFVTLEGEKMSKSKGNIIAPQEVMEKYGADALRFWAASSKLGEDLDYQEKEVVTGKKFMTKIFNATKFVFLNLKKIEKARICEIDRLFLIKLNEVIENSTLSFESYEYSRAKQEADRFFWHIFCDNYLEIVKRRVYSGKKEEQESAYYTLYNSLLAILKLFAPFTPFITEELYQKYFKKHEKEKSIHLSKWTEKFKIKENKDDEEKLQLLLEIIKLVREKKSKNKKSMKAEIMLFLEKDKQEKLKDVLKDLKDVCNAREIKEGNFEARFL